MFLVKCRNIVHTIPARYYATFSKKDIYRLVLPCTYFECNNVISRYCSLAYNYTKYQFPLGTIQICKAWKSSKELLFMKKAPSNVTDRASNAQYLVTQ